MKRFIKVVGVVAAAIMAAAASPQGREKLKKSRDDFKARRAARTLNPQSVTVHKDEKYL